MTLYFKVMGWLLSIGMKLVKVVPVQSTLAVVLALFSQLSQVVAFLLPLKVIILLGSPGTPRYFPDFMQNFERDPLVVMLAAISVTLYLVHLLLDNLVSRLVASGSSFLMERSAKLALLERQDELAHSFYHHFIVFLSGVSLAVVAAVFFAIFKPVLLVVVVVYMLLALMLVDGVCHYWSRLKEEVSESIGSVISVVAAIGFMIVFAFLIVEFMAGAENELLFSILALLLSRQLFNRLGMALKALHRLYTRRDRVRALFFHNAPLVNEKVRSELDFWQMMQPELCQSWAAEALGDIGIKDADIQYRYLDAGIRRQMLLLVTVSFQNGQPSRYLFKVFDKRNSLVAKHEAALLKYNIGDFAPRLVHRSEKQRFIALLLSCGSVFDDALLGKGKSKLAKPFLLERLWLWTVPDGLRSAYTRSRSTLPFRLNKAFWSHCQVAAAWFSPETKNNIDWFAHNSGLLNAALRQLPLCVFVPRMPDSQVFTVGSGYFFSNWGLWQLEPAGFGWPVRLGAQELEHAFARAIEQDMPHLGSFSYQHLWLAALTAEFEKKCNRGCYSEAFDLLEEMRQLLSSLQISDNYLCNVKI